MKLILTILLILAIAGFYFFYSDSLMSQKMGDHELHLEFVQETSEVKGLNSMNQYNAISERPLFIEEREFVAKEEVKVVNKPQPRVEELKVKALGVALTNEGVLAVIKDLKNGKNLRLRIGEKIYGWRLEGVSESSFTFSKGGKEKLIAFKE